MRRLWWALALACTCTSPTAFGAEALEPVPIPETSSARSYAYAAVPLVSYSSDAGLGLGLRGVIQRRLGDDEQYAFSLEAQGFATTGGTQFDFAFLDVPRLGGGPLRLDVLAGYDRNTAAPYYGIGNHPALASSEPTPLDTYLEEYPVLRTRLRGRVWRDLSAMAGYRLLLQRVVADPRSHLAQDSPLGIGGGPYSEASIGLGWDTRDNEMEPTRGALLEATIRGTAPITGSRYLSGGTFSSAAAYQATAARVVVAGTRRARRDVGRCAVRPAAGLWLAPHAILSPERSRWRSHRARPPAKRIRRPDEGHCERGAPLAIRRYRRIR